MTFLPKSNVLNPTLAYLFISDFIYDKCSGSFLLESRFSRTESAPLVSSKI